ncbi:MAG: acyl-CoA dehydrogenase family protein [Chloroflexota bacterium]
MDYSSDTMENMTFESINSGRRRLEEWRSAQPDNFFVSDRNLQRLLEFYWGEERYREHLPRLLKFGAVAATKIDEAARESNKDENLPRLRRYDENGRRVEAVDFHPSYHEAGRAIYGSGVMSVYESSGNNLLSLALFYLSSLNGEAGHNCPLACTAGLIKVLQAEGSQALRARYLPRLLDSDYDNNYHGAQFLTEVQGGSDVGANDTRATPLDPAAEGTWLLNGEKWFCSNVTADLALVTARVQGQGEGTAGLGLFLVPRYLEDGQLNSLYVRRLKDKLGTRSMATGEIEFRDALAYQVGEPARGFRNVMTYVINTSRIFNAMGCSANARRAYITAWTYAKHRLAFDRAIIHYPLVQETLTQMRSDTAAMLSGTARLIHTMDEVETGRKQDAETGHFLRMALNLNKYRSAVLAHGVVQQGIEVLGGNGAVEDFSILPRLLRDNVVYENWEGAHNVLLAQVQRDMHRYQVHEAFFALVREMLEPLPFSRLKREGVEQLEEMREQLDALLQMDPLHASIPFRVLMDRLTDLYYVACMGVEAAWENYKKKDRTKQRLAEYFFDRRVMGRSSLEIPNYAEQVSRLCADVRPRKVDRLRDEEDDEL